MERTQNILYTDKNVKPKEEINIINCNHKFSELKYIEEGPYMTSCVTVKGGAEMRLYYCEKCGIVVVKPIVRM